MIAVVVIVVVVLVMALLIHGCESSQSKNSLKNYVANVDTLMTASYNNGAKMFSYLQQDELATASGEQSLQLQLAGNLQKADSELSQAEDLSAPGQLAATQSALVQTMQLRYDGIGYVANNIQGAVATKTSKTAVGQIATGMFLLATSDVIYKTYVGTGIAKALNDANIVIGGTTGAQIFAGQILNDLGWVDTRFVGEKLGADLPASAVNTVVKGAIQGHALTSVTVGGTPLSESSTNTIAASPAPTFTLNFTNGGTVDEYDVKCEVTVQELSDTGTYTEPVTKAGQSYSCPVTLQSVPTASAFSVTARIVKVPGEKNLTNNAMTFPVQFN